MPASSIKVFLLRVDECVTPWRVFVARSFIERAVGVGRGPTWKAFEILHLPRCRAVHGLWMDCAIDVVFSDRAGKIVQVLSRWPPRRIAWHSAASQVWEMAAGSAAARGLRTGVRIGLQPAGTWRGGACQ